MVRSFFRIIRKEVVNLHTAAYTVALLTLLAQILALFRDRIFAFSFGAGETLDFYYAAFRLPDILFALIASLVSAYILIPLIAKACTESKEEARRLLSDAVSFFIIVMGLAGIIAAIYAPKILALLYPAFVEHVQFDEFVLLSRILLLQPLFLGLSSIISSVTQIERRFLLYALSPVLYNVGIILGALFLEPIFGIIGLGFGVLLGSIFHMALHVPVVLSSQVLPLPKVPNIRRMWGVVTKSSPRALALSSQTFIIVGVTVLAAPLAVGSITIFSFAHNLQSIPLSLIGASYAVVAFPTLATLHAAKDVEAFARKVADAARHLVLWSMLALVLFIILRAHIVRVVLGAGEFTWDDTRLTAAVLALLVASLVGQALVLLIARAYYAAGKTYIPLIIQGIGAIVSLVSAWALLIAHTNNEAYVYFLEALLRISFVPGTEIVSIALGVTIGQIVAGILGFVLFANMYPSFGVKLMPVIFQSFAASIIAGAVAYTTLSLLGGIFALTSLVAVLAQGALAGTLGLAAFIFVLYILSNREFREIRAGVQNFLGKKKLEPQSEF